MLLIATTKSFTCRHFGSEPKGRNRAGRGGGGGGGGGVRSNPLRTGLAAATSATWYSRSDDCVSNGMFQHETVSLDVHMYRLGHGSLHCAPFFYLCSVHVSMHVPCLLIMGPPSSPSTLVWGPDDFSYLVPRLPLLCMAYSSRPFIFSSPCQIEIIHKVYPPVILVLYACVYMLRIHLMYNLCSRSK